MRSGSLVHEEDGQDTSIDTDVDISNGTNGMREGSIGAENTLVYDAKVLKVEVGSLIVLWEEVFGEEVQRWKVKASSYDDDVCSQIRLVTIITRLGASLSLVELDRVSLQLKNISSNVVRLALSNVIERARVDDRCGRVEWTRLIRSHLLFKTSVMELAKHELWDE